MTSNYSKTSVRVMETDTGKPRSPEAHGEVGGFLRDAKGGTETTWV